MRLILCLLVSILLQGCGVGYVLTSSARQAELLCARVDNDLAARSDALSPQQREALSWVPHIKRFGRMIGLEGSRNYDTVALGWERAIWNTSATPPLSFEPRTWWFPVVGEVPYLGFFSEAEAREQAADLDAEGLDTYARPAATYSTLGWFEDPLLLPMLDWPESDLANVLLHELTHATVWAPGGVDFNESLANFVGELASLAYLAWRYGTEDPRFVEATRRADDRARWRDLLLGLYHDLNAAYTDPALTDPERLDRKAALLASLPARVQRAGFYDAPLYLQAAIDGPWNNARLAQFRTYNDNRRWFAALLDREGGELRPFLLAIAALADDHDDPNAALRDAAQAHLRRARQPDPPDPRQRVLRRLGLLRPTAPGTPPPAPPQTP
jgi:predicted aminopeptidase